jgi:tripartite-type tricarboxylate transporter receptor subunit TctC
MQRREFMLGAVGALAGAPALSQAWPTRPVKLIVPYPPGGANDIIARLYAQELQAALGQTFVVDNRAGAGGEIGAEAAARSTPDGYSLLFAAIGSLTIHAVLPAAQKPGYDLKTDLLPVSMGAGVPLAIAVRASLPVSSVKEFLDYARAQKQSVSYGSAGNGSTQHMTGEYFKSVTGIPMLHVAYKGSGPALTDLLGGQIDMVFETLPALSAHFTNPKIKILAVTGAARSELLPETPTLRDSGVPGFEVTTYYGLLAPKGTPKAIVEQVSAAMQAIAQKPQMQAALNKQGAVAVATTPARMEAMIQAEIEKWARVQQSAQIKA